MYPTFVPQIQICEFYILLTLEYLLLPLPL